MDWLTFIAETIKALTWPGVILVLFFMLKKPISSIIPFLEKLKYKDFELQFSKQISVAKTETEREIPQLAGTNDSDEKNNEKMIGQLAISSPKSLILTSWDLIEEAAHKKIKEFYTTDEITKRRIIKENSVNHLEYTGVLTPSVNRLLQKLYSLKNQASTFPDNVITIEDATDFFSMARKCIRIIESISELPSMKLTALSILIMEITALIDTGKYDHIKINDIHKAINSGKILHFLRKEAGDDIDLSIFLETTTYPNFEETYNEHLARFLNAYGGDERRKWGIENSGLCLLVSWSMEIIKQGSGWLPSE